MPALTIVRVAQACVAALLLGAATPAAAAVPPAVAAGPVRLGYTVYAGGFEVLQASLLLDVEREDYTLEVSARTQGLLGALFNWSTNARSSGMLRDGDALPRSHRQTGSWRGGDREVSLDYDGRGGVRAVVVRPTAEEDDREPVPPELTPRTLDPLSAVLSVAADVAVGRGCSDTVPVFDGRRRYDLVFQAKGRHELAPNRYSVFSGPAFLCEVSSKVLAGNWRREGRWTSEEEKRRPVALMLAPLVEGLPPVPVRLEGESRFGDVIMHLTSVERVRGSDTAELPPAQ
jgi:hypothetical protein